MSNNKQHPELKEGEEFLENSTISDFNQIECESKRLGSQSFDVNGNDISSLGLRPVFKKIGDKHTYPPYDGHIHDDELLHD